MRGKLIKVLAVLNIFCAIELSAQEVEITGIVLENYKKTPLEGVLVMLKSIEKNTILSYTQTSSDGKYSLKTSYMGQELKLEFSLLGYSSGVIIYSGQHSPIEVLLEEKAIDIKEVTIKAPPVRKHGDTITYTVANFAHPQDRTIGDVLKKIPGIEVETSGAIKHNGIPINKFYVEGLDLLEGRYGIATNGIPRQSIQSIEIFENHQPKKVLEDFIIPENSAINLKLKETAKSKWIGTAQTGLGIFPFLWETELLGMRFAKTSQSMNTFKSNNTGKDIIGETKSLNLEDILKSDTRYYPVSYIEPSFINTTGAIDEKRTRFNKTHALSSTQLWKLGKDYELKGQLVYTKNKLEGNSIISNHYFLKNDTVVIEEQKAATLLQDKLDMGLVLSANTKNFFLQNKFSSNLNWNTTGLSVFGTYPSVQKSRLPDISFANSFEFTKKINKQIVDIDVYNMFFSKDHSFNMQQAEKLNYQQVNSSGTFSNISASYSLGYNNWTFSLHGGFSLLMRKIENYLHGNALPLNILTVPFESSFSYLCPNLTPTLEYKKKSLTSSLKLNMNHYRYSYTTQDKNIKKVQFAISPEVSLRYYLSSKFSILIAGEMKTHPVEERNLYEGIIMQNYISLQQGFGSFVNEKSKSVSFGIYHKDPLNLFYANASVFRVWNSNPMVRLRTFIDNYILNSFLLHPENSNIWKVDGRLSKGVSFCNGVFAVQASYSSIESAMIQQEDYTPYLSDAFLLKPGIMVQLTPRINAEYTFSYLKYIFSATKINYKAENSQVQHNIKFNILPSKRLRIFLTGEYYNNEITERQTKDFFLMDGGIYYGFSKGWEVNISLSNVFNEKQYAYMVTNELQRAYSQYSIRPRNVLISLYIRL